MKKLNFLGIGPRIAMVMLPWLILTIVLSRSNKSLFAYTSQGETLFEISGIILMALGLVFYLSTVRLLLKGLKDTVLLTSGPYGICQNPLYSSIILCIIPALSLLLNSWLILTSSIAGFVLFKIFIGKEYKELEKFFGEDYLKYKNSTPEFFPILFKKRP